MKPTQEQAKYFLPFIQALADGKEVEYKMKNTNIWYKCEEINEVFSNKDYVSFDFRVKPTLKLRPWRPEEVPVGALIQFKENLGSKAIIIDVKFSNPSLGALCGDSWLSLNDLFLYKEHSLNHGKTWLPCGVME